MNQWEDLSTLLRHFIERGGPTGCGVGVMQDGRLLYETWEGIRNVETGEAMRADTIFRLASMTKVITCTALMMLYERGLFLLNDPVSEYLPEWKNATVISRQGNGDYEIVPAKNPILIRHLMNMSSGLPHGGENSESGRRILEKTMALSSETDGNYSTRAFSKAIAQAPLAFEPGTQWHYGHSHDILGALIEVLSGKTFGTFLQEEIFQPLEMKDTFFRIPEEKKSRLCPLYGIQDGRHVPVKSKGENRYQQGALFESGGGGLLSTLADYSRFAQVLACGGEQFGVRLLGRQTIDLMRMNHLSPCQQKDFNWGYLAGYGYGLGVRTMVNPPAGGVNGALGEFGWCGALGTWVMIDPENRLSAVYMQQLIPNLEEYHQPRMRAVIYGALKKEERI